MIKQGKAWYTERDEVAWGRTCHCCSSAWCSAPCDLHEIDQEISPFCPLYICLQMNLEGGNHFLNYMCKKIQETQVDI